MAVVGRFGNRQTRVGHEVFDSKAEAADWQQLRLLEMAGQIRNLSRQVLVELQPAFTDREGKRHRAITWTVDFVYEEEGYPVAFETKGHRTDAYVMKEKLFRYRYPEFKLIVHQIESRRRSH